MKTLIFLAVLFILPSISNRAAEPEAGETEKVYRDYMEAYKKAAESYEKATKETQSSAYITYSVLGIFLVCGVVIITKNLRDQKAFRDKYLQLTLANQKLLEEIRDLLKTGR